MSEEAKEMLRRLGDIEDSVALLDDVVRGDVDRELPGLLQDVRLLKEFVLKWDKREYAFRAVMLLLSSNILLTILTLVATFLFQ